jgi:hypothetical protein
MKFRACFYKGTRPGWHGLYNRAVRWWTNSNYSHMEIQFSDGLSASSSFEDGGVRFKQIGYTSDNWDFIDLPEWMEPYCRRYFGERVGRKYDVWGQFHFVFFIIRGAVSKLFCSEIGVESLGVQEGQGYRFNPGDAFAFLSSALFSVRKPTFINIEFSKP